jgi:uracil-DNA glycosylase
MQPSKCVGCQKFPCDDVRQDRYLVPDIDVKPDSISIIMISEAAPDNSEDYYYAGGNPLFEQTTVQAFNDAGINVSTIKDLINMGVYFTTAIKCGKTGYGIRTDTIKECSFLLGKELNLFPELKVLMLMGDVAIKSINYIARRLSGERVIPAGSTYKLRSQEYYFRGKRVFPSYLQAGPSFFIEKSKRRMIREDIAAALSLVKMKKI